MNYYNVECVKSLSSVETYNRAFFRSQDNAHWNCAKRRALILLLLLTIIIIKKKETLAQEMRVGENVIFTILLRKHITYYTCIINARSLNGGPHSRFARNANNNPIIVRRRFVFCQPLIRMSSVIRPLKAHEITRVPLVYHLHRRPSNTYNIIRR